MIFPVTFNIPPTNQIAGRRVFSEIAARADSAQDGQWDGHKRKHAVDPSLELGALPN